MATTYRRSNFKRRRRTAEERRALELESLQRVTTSTSWANFPQIIAEFMARGIPADQISPKENVFTYNAWRALGRQVRRGEKSVKVTVFYPIADRGQEGADEDKKAKRLRPVTACVFHISQTDPIGDAPASSSAAPTSAPAVAPAAKPTAADCLRWAIDRAHDDCYGAPTAQQVDYIAFNYFHNCQAAQSNYKNGREFAAAAVAQFTGAASSAAEELAADQSADDCNDCGRPLNEFGQCASADVLAPCRALAGPIAGPIAGELLFD